MQPVARWFYEDYMSRRMREDRAIAEKQRRGLSVKRALRRSKA